MKWMMRAPWLALAVLATLPSLFGCELRDPNEFTVTYENETDFTLWTSGAELSGGESARYTYYKPMDAAFYVAVYDLGNCKVYSLDTTRRELQTEYDLTITIFEEDVADCISSR